MKKQLIMALMLSLVVKVYGQGNVLYSEIQQAKESNDEKVPLIEVENKFIIRGWQIPLSASGGADSITIEGGALAVGIYYYSLYVDNSLVDTKKNDFNE
jgi:hypothetical protein